MEVKITNNSSPRVAKLIGHESKENQNAKTQPKNTHIQTVWGGTQAAPASVCMLMPVKFHLGGVLAIINIMPWEACCLVFKNCA